MTRLLTSFTAAALLLAVGTGAQAQMSPAPNATAPANPAMSGTAMQRGTMPAPAPMAAPMPAAAPTAAARPMRRMHSRHHAAPMHAKPMAHHRMTGRHARGGNQMGARMAPREAGSASVDQLNEQSLARARAGQ